MSGDVQPKKRKDKRRKKDETPSQEDPVIQASTPPPVDDYSIHVHSDHGTGGGLFAKFVFFVLLSVLVVLIGIVITKNRGVTDLDTPASDSRFAKIFEGWLDESTPEHDDHAAAEFGVDHDDEHGEEHGDEEHGDDEHEEEHDEDEHEEEHDEDEHADKEEEPSDEHAESAEDEQVSEDKEEEAEQDDEQASEEDEEQQVSEDEEQDNEQSIDEASEEPEDDEQGDDDDDDKTEELDTITNEEDDTNEDNDDVGDVISQEDQQGGDNDDDDDTVEDDEDDGDDNENPFNEEADDNDDEKSDENQVQSEEDNPDEHDGGSQEISTENEVIEEESAEEETEGADDDEEQELVIDNTAGEEELLKQEAEKNIEAEEESSNVAVKFGVGVALVVVAHIVLVRKWRCGQNKDNKTSVEESAGAPSSRRHTIVSPPPLQQIEHDIQNVEDEYSEEEAEEESEEDIHIEPVQSKSEYLELRTTYQKLTPEEDIREKIAGLIGQHTDEQTPFFDEPGDEYEEEEEEEEEGYEDEEVEVQGDETQEQDEPEQEDPEQDEPEQEEEDVEYGDKEEDEIPVEGDEYEEEEEEISDVDDEELLKKLEAKYGKLPQSNKTDKDEEEGEEEEEEEEDIPNKFGSWKKIKVPASEEKNWKKSVPDSKEKLKTAEARIKDNPEIALGIINELIKQHPEDVDVKYGRAKALDKLAEQKRSNEILQEAISAYYDLLRNHNLPDDIFKKVADRCIDRMRFRGHYFSAVHVHKQLINRFPNEPSYQNQLAVTYLTINRLAEAKRVLQDVLMRWPNNGFAQVHFGFVLKTFDNDISAAVKYLRSGIASREPGVIDGRFYFHLGDALTRLGKPNEATKVYEDGVKYKVFLSRYQRSLYNVDRLTAKPWWQLNDTPYAKFFKMLEEKWKVIRDEGIALLNKAGYFKDESENLRDFGEWKQYELYARGMKFTENCKKCPETCKIIDMFPDARTCKRGQIKFSVMHPGTHVWPHCGPTNCRLRAHLGLKVPPKTYIRVADETRSWEEGKMFLFDDSFEHEVWHNGTELRLVLIVDVWHPELTPAEKNSLPAI